MKGKQRYFCKKCSYRFISGDLRTKKTEGNAQKIALAVCLYSQGSMSYREIAKLLNKSAATIMIWINTISKKIKLPEIKEDDVVEIEIDEMWHFISKKKLNYGLLKLLIAKQKN